MQGSYEKPRNGIALIQLLPNVLTVLAICAGLTAIRCGVQGNYVLAVQLILAAGVLDGLDGRLARALGCDSKMGAELDSLADFLNFGVAPPLIVYFWTLQDVGNTAWVAVLIFSMCCVMRLARFNVSNNSEAPGIDSAYFEGVPAPAGALLAMLPMYVSFVVSDPFLMPDIVICVHMALVGLLMISRIPTWSFKSTRISRDNVKFFLIAVVAVLFAVLNFAWITLILFCLGYIAVVIWSWLRKPAARKTRAIAPAPLPADPTKEHDV